MRSSVRLNSVIQSALLLKDSRWRWTAGLEAAAANALVMTASLLAGSLRVGLVASLGAFTALYGNTLAPRRRLQLLPLVAAGFVLASGLGACSAGRDTSVAACLVAVSLLGSILVFAAGLDGPGPMQFVLVAAVSARVAIPPYTGAANPLNPTRIPAVVAIGCIAAYLVVASSLAMQRVFRKEHAPIAHEPPLPIKLTAEQWTILRRVVLAVAAAAALSLALHLAHAHWMIMVAGAVLQSTRAAQHSAVRAIQRVFGTMVGVLLFATIEWAAPAGVSLIAVLAALQFLVEVVVTRSYAAALAFITPTALVIAASASGKPPIVLASERVVDTALGAMVALVVLWITRGREEMALEIR